jgi:N12 class adenine-specific DNA methylase/adenine-specific DNA methylase
LKPPPPPVFTYKTQNTKEEIPAMKLDERLKIIYETIASAVTRSETAWKDYLRFGSQIYKHQFDNALLVYAQTSGRRNSDKPLMLATMQIWNKINRYVNRGEKATAVCEYHNSALTTKYLFDVTQTNGSAVPEVWKLDNTDIKHALAEKLPQSRGIKADNLYDCISEMVEYTVFAAFEKHMINFDNDIRGHFFEDLPREGLYEELSEVIENSCKFFVASRCGIEMPDTEMSTISHFDTVPLVARLGYTVTEISKGILYEIERTVKMINNEQKQAPRPIKQTAAPILEAIPAAEPAMAVPPTAEAEFIKTSEPQKSGSFFMPDETSVPTDEEIITQELMRGSGFEDGKFRIEETAKKNLKPAEFAEFLKNEYGTGGHSGDGIVRFVDHDSKGLHFRIMDDFTPSGERKFSINWNNAAKRIAALVKNNEYLTPEEIKQKTQDTDEEHEIPETPLTPYNRYLKAKLDYPNHIIFTQVGDFYEVYGDDAEVLSELLGFTIINIRRNNEEVKMCGFPVHAAFNYSNRLMSESYPVFVITSELEFEATYINPDVEKALNNIKKETASTVQLSLFGDEAADEVVVIAAESNDVYFKENLAETAIIPYEIIESYETINVDGGEIEIIDYGEPEITPYLNNYRFSEADNLYTDAVGLKTGFSVKAKFKANIEAIKLVKILDAERRFATPDEQKILANYVGWGGLANAFDENASGWQKENEELRLLLNDDEYQSAMDSTLTAYYTDPKLIKHIYNALENFGFTDGRNRKILDPAMGTGNFYSVLPDGLSNATLHGVELDGITGRIAKYLYPNAEIGIQGFETTTFENESMDVVVGNIPFNDIKVFDKEYKDENFLIHDYFIAKSLNLLKSGGIAALITSKGTMDKISTSAREYFAQRAELIGAVRLPNNAFKEIAGTEVTTDILFFRKREEIQHFNRYDGSLPDWIYSNYGNHNFRMNEYFIQNPEMILGEMKEISGRFGYESACIAPDDYDLHSALETALGKLHAQFTAEPDPEQSLNIVIESTENETSRIKAPIGTKNCTYFIKDNAIYYCESGYLEKQEVKGIKAERIKGLCEIRIALLEVIEIQKHHYDYKVLERAMKGLNYVYDRFYAKYGAINSKANIMAFSDDDQQPLLCSIEDYVKENDTYKKAAVFEKATINFYRIPDSAETAKEALEISLNVKMKVDIPYMAQLYGKSEEEVIEELGDRIYLNPAKFYGNHYEGWETAEEYLSGNIKDKLQYSLLKAEDNEIFRRNAEVLKAVIPEPLMPSDIYFHIGSPWIPKEYYEQFMYETFGDSDVHRDYMKLSYSEYTNNYNISSKSSFDSIAVNQTYGTKRINAYEIYEDCLNLQFSKVSDPVEYTDKNGDRKTKYVVNPTETMIAREKQQQIQESFKNWTFRDKERAEALLKIYNDKFNVIRPREYDGSHLVFPNMSEEMKLRPHQLNVAARIIYGDNCLMAHDVGAGKTSSMIAAGMYMKTMVLVKKPIYVVPNGLVRQWAAEFYRFFPSANILAPSDKDFSAKNRKKLIARMAMGEYDGIIIAHSQFEKIPISKERQKFLLNKQISELTTAINKMKYNSGENWSVKQIGIFRKRLQFRLERLIKDEWKDDNLNFEELGVDYIFVDEAHMYKNCQVYSKLRNIAGINQSDNQKTQDMLMKINYLYELHNGKALTKATGTTISNSMTEMFVMQRYLQPKTLSQMGFHFFDSWVANYGNIKLSLEIKPEGNGYQMKTRLASFNNLPELMSMFRLVADIQTAEMLDLPIPGIEGGKPEVVVTQRTEAQKQIMDSLVERAEKIRDKKVHKSEDNMLRITNEAKLMAIAPRLVDPNAENDGSSCPQPDSKLNTCVNRVHSIWEKTADRKLTQVIFCDSGVPNGKAEFNVYDEMKNCLIEKGLPANEIAFVHDAKNDAQREALFEKVRTGEVRVIIGSTGKLGTGVNVQNKLIALHHIDAPWRPAEVGQTLRTLAG